MLLVKVNGAGGVGELQRLSTPLLLAALILYLAFAYAVGLVLSSCGSLINDLYWVGIFRNVAGTYAAVFRESCKEFGISAESGESVVKAALLSKQDCAKLYRMGHEYLKRNDLEARLVLPKMQAEAGLLTSLAYAVIFGYAAYIVIDRQLPSGSAVAMGVGLLVLCVWSARYRTQRLFERQFSYLALNLPKSAVSTG